jgi:hypothetical protein
MDRVTVRKDVPYGQADDGPLVMDVYDPIVAADGPRAAVIIVSGYPGTPGRPAYKSIGWAVSMAQLIAASGMVAIAFTNRDPAADLRALLDYLHEHATELDLDPARLGILAVSGNVPTAMTTMLRTASRPPACAAFAYGCFLDLDGSTDVASAVSQFGFVNACAGQTVADLRNDVPIFIARAGHDQLPAMKGSVDRFMAHALAANLPVTFVNHAEGPHAFDLFDDSRTSRDVIRTMLRFLRQHLLSEAHD